MRPLLSDIVRASASIVIITIIDKPTKNSVLAALCTYLANDLLQFFRYHF